MGQAEQYGSIRALEGGHMKQVISVRPASTTHWRMVSRRWNRHVRLFEAGFNYPLADGFPKVEPPCTFI